MASPNRAMLIKLGMRAMFCCVVVWCRNSSNSPEPSLLLYEPSGERGAVLRSRRRRRCWERCTGDGTAGRAGKSC